jgi:hypothetical protein
LHIFSQIYLQTDSKVIIIITIITKGQSARKPLLRYTLVVVLRAARIEPTQAAPMVHVHPSIYGSDYLSIYDYLSI